MLQDVSLMLRLAAMFFLGVGCGVGLALIALPSRRPKAPAGQHDRL
jgi:hypothetical protein